MSYAYVLQRLGEPERAAVVLETTLDSLQGDPRLGQVGYGIADVEALALMGRPEDALARLREAINAGWRSSWYRGHWNLRDDPFLGSLREDPSFLAMVGEVEADVARMAGRALQAEASGDWQPLLALAERGPVLRAEAIRR